MAEGLETDVERGLTGAAAARRLGSDGYDELDENPGPSWPRLLANQLLSPMILLLTAAAPLSAVLGETTEALVIAGGVLLNTGIGLQQERKGQAARRPRPAHRPARWP